MLWARLLQRGSVQQFQALIVHNSQWWTPLAVLEELGGAMQADGHGSVQE